MAFIVSLIGDGDGDGGAATFLELTDTPATYVSQAGKFPRVNLTETGLEFADEAGLGDVSGPASAIQYSVPIFFDATGKIIDSQPFLLTDGAQTTIFQNIIGSSGNVTLADFRDQTGASKTSVLLNDDTGQFSIVSVDDLLASGANVSLEATGAANYANVFSYNTAETASNYLQRGVNTLNYDDVVFGLETGDGAGAATGGVLFTFDPSDPFGSIIVTDSVNSRGMRYADDYSALFTNRSIPDVGYVQNLVLGSGFVVGPNSSTDNHLVIWDDVSGELVKDTSTVSLSSTNVFSTSSTDGLSFSVSGAGNIILATGTGQILLNSGSSANVVGLNSAKISADGGGSDVTVNNSSGVLLQSTIGGVVQIPDSLKYAADYSGAFTDRSLIDQGTADGRFILQPGTVTDNALLSFNGTSGGSVQELSTTWISAVGGTNISTPGDLEWLLTGSWDLSADDSLTFNSGLDFSIISGTSSAMTANSGDLSLSALDGNVNISALLGQTVIDTPLAVVTGDSQLQGRDGSYFFDQSFDPTVQTTLYTQYIGTYSYGFGGVVVVTIGDNGSNHGSTSRFEVSARLGQPPSVRALNATVGQYTIYYRPVSTRYELFWKDNYSTSANITYRVTVDTYQLFTDVISASDDVGILEMDYAIYSDVSTSPPKTAINGVPVSQRALQIFGDQGAEYPDDPSPNFTDSSLINRLYADQRYGGSSLVTNVFTEDDFGPDVGGVITIEQPPQFTQKIYIVQENFVMSKRIVVDAYSGGTGGAVIIQGIAVATPVITYIGGETCISTTINSGFASVIDVSFLNTVDGGQIADTTGSTGGLLTFDSSIMLNIAAGTNTKVMTIDNVSQAFLFDVQPIGFWNGVTVDNVETLRINTQDHQNSPNPDYVAVDVCRNVGAVINANTITLTPTSIDQALINISPLFEGTATFAQCAVESETLGSFFRQTGEVGDVVSQTNVSASYLESGNVQVSDDNGEAQFDYIAGTSIYQVGQVVSTSGFAEASYNVTDAYVTATDGSSWIKIGVSFVAAQAGGTISSNVAQYNSPNGLSVADEVYISRTINLDGGGVVLAVNPVSYFHINFPIGVVPGNYTEIGEYSSNSLDQTNPRVITALNSRQEDSETIGAIVTNAVSSTVTALTQNVWTDLILTGPGQAQYGVNVERFNIVNYSSGEMEYIGLEGARLDASGFVGVQASASAPTLAIRLIKNGGELLPPENVVAAAEVQSTAGGSQISFNFSARVETFDRFRLQITNLTGGQDATVQSLKFTMK